MKRQEVPLFEGQTDIQFLPGRIRALPPANVVIPIGYRIVISLDLAGDVPIATYQVLKSPGLWARYLRWRFPFTEGS